MQVNDALKFYFSREIGKILTFASTAEQLQNKLDKG